MEFEKEKLEREVKSAIKNFKDLTFKFDCNQEF
jgi:hypothetical protein